MFYEVSVCTCCTLINANGEDGCESHECALLALLLLGERLVTSEAELYFSGSVA